MIRLSLPLPVKDAVKRIEVIFLEEGFERFSSHSVSELVASRIGVETAPAKLLLFVHPVVAFQCLVAGGDSLASAAVLVVVKGAPGRSSIVRAHLGPRGAEDCCQAGERFVAQQGRLLVLRALGRLNPDWKRRIAAEAETPSAGGQ